MQIISVAEHISKVRFGWLEDTTSILSYTYDMVLPSPCTAFSQSLSVNSFR